MCWQSDVLKCPLCVNANTFEGEPISISLELNTPFLLGSSTHCCSEDVLSLFLTKNIGVATSRGSEASRSIVIVTSFDAG
jgi:hypothetical protein